MQSLRAGAILAVFLIVTFILIPLQWFFLKLRLARRRSFPHAYHKFVAWLFGIHIRVIGRPVRRACCCWPITPAGWTL